MRNIFPHNIYIRWWNRWREGYYNFKMTSQNVKCFITLVTQFKKSLDLRIFGFITCEFKKTQTIPLVIRKRTKKNVVIMESITSTSSLRGVVWHQLNSIGQWWHVVLNKRKLTIKEKGKIIDNFQERVQFYICDMWYLCIPCFYIR